MIDTDDGFAPLLARRVRDNPAGLFARYEGAPISFAELDRMASALALVDAPASGSRPATRSR